MTGTFVNGYDDVPAGDQEVSRSGHGFPTDGREASSRKSSFWPGSFQDDLLVDVRAPSWRKYLQAGTAVRGRQNFSPAQLSVGETLSP
jgi:hypothetical protein